MIQNWAEYNKEKTLWLETHKYGGSARLRIVSDKAGLLANHLNDLQKKGDAKGGSSSPLINEMRKSSLLKSSKWDDDDDD